MEINEYQKEIINFINMPPEIIEYYCGLGLSEEVGKISMKLREILLHPDDIVDEKVILQFAKIMGDIVFYIAALGASMDISMQEIIDLNLRKIRLINKQNTENGEQQQQQ